MSDMEATTTALLAMDVMELTPTLLLLVPIILALVEAVKRIVDLGRWTPAVALVFGVGASFLFQTGDVTTTIVQGVLLGLTAVGLYSGTRATIR